MICAILAVEIVCGKLICAICAGSLLAPGEMICAIYTVELVSTHTICAIYIYSRA